ncbi:hypothetical protein IVB16_34725 [Bradyrhizobium sp. 183]|uniref:hypothetical protein n=1 Tax=unclassified Bradyrhizobium TaxID=2631580 RepID=UPI002000065F|nr:MULTISPECIES: hypothetical protein [unclassified Bradyrhizobium]UPJ79746.1 hypothetical protein IVB17_34720 [Bradyrhizobium sp. 184]UPJ87541.1 hypothetical protein IVB16_34725 [Bradyrhizobium sp. 183]
MQANAAVIVQTLRVSELRFEQALKGAIPFVVEGVSLALRLAEFIDLAVEEGPPGQRDRHVAGRS